MHRFEAPSSRTTPDRRSGPEPLPCGRRFDGVICFGGVDWWYHNRGHYDIRMMRELAGHMPVLYVNSIGMRRPRPSEGRFFLTRIARKLRSLKRGLTQVDDRFAVLTPPAAPGGLNLPLSRRVLAASVSRAATRLGIRHPLVWVACPTAAEVCDQLGAAGLVYQRTDRYEAFDGVDEARITACDEWLKARADLTVFCSTLLHQREAGACRATSLIDHGVDLHRFRDAETADVPRDVAALPGPRVGFVGGIDDHTFDAALLRNVARRLPDVQFVLIGTCSLPHGCLDEPNITLLGQRPVEDVPRYLFACDALIMPWRQSDWIEACHPVKLKEYLAAGRPIVTTWFAEVDRYKGLVHIARDDEAFAVALDQAVSERHDALPGRRRVANASWANRAQSALDRLAEVGVRPAADGSLTPSACPRMFRETSPARRGDRDRLALRDGPLSIESAFMNDGALPRIAAEAIGLGGGAPSLSRVTGGRDLGGPDLACAVVLAGGFRPSPLVESARRSVLDLWLTPDGSVLHHWTARIAELDGTRAGPTPVRIVHDGAATAPWPGRLDDHVRIELEPRPFRGPAGLLRDVCNGVPADATVLVVEAARYASVSLTPLRREHARSGADITVGVNPDGSPAGVYLIRAGSLSVAQPVGFMDLKEQWLNDARDQGFCVRVHRFADHGVMQLHSREAFLAAAAVANGHLGSAILGDTGASPATPMRVICAGALVGPGSIIIDSVVMPDAVIGADSVLVRSLVCPGTSVQAGSNVADAVTYADVADFGPACA